MPAILKKKPRRKCASCREWFHPARDGQIVCSYECVCTVGKEQTKKDRVASQRNELSHQRAAEKKKRAEWRQRKADVKPLSHWISMTQRAVNDWRREMLLADGHGCISCGTHAAFAWHAGHYRTTVTAPQLRFSPDNIWLQCSACNVHKSGNIDAYRAAQVELIGEERVQALEANHDIHRYTREELAGIRAVARAKLPFLQKAGGCMTAQFLEFARQQLIVATADLSGATKGQSMAWLENAQFDTNTFKRKKPRVLDEVTGKMITLDNPPIPGKQSQAKGSHIPLVQPVEYATASWRRAVLSLEEHHKAWLLWNYTENTRWEHQEVITRWAWVEFQQQLAGKRIAKKTMDRLRQLIWLAAQDVKEGLAGRYTYQYADLAVLVGVTPKN